MSKILIIRLTSLGDVIFTVPLACTLKNNNANTKIGWLVAEKGLEVVKNNPCVDFCHFVPLNEWKKHPFFLKTFKGFIQLIKEVRKEKYDIALDCQQMFKTLFLFLFSGAKRRITFKDARELSILGGNEFIKPKAPFRDFNYHIVERNLDFARHLGVEPQNIKFSLPETSQSAKNKINELTNSLDKSKPTVVISPATTWKNKHWAEKNWGEVIEAIHKKCNLVFTGTNADEELIELFSRAKIVISPDSGSAHLAWASRNPAVITIFTCTPAKRFGPYEKQNGGQKYVSISSNLDCQPCFKNKCKLKVDRNSCRNVPAATEIITIINNLL